MSIPGSTSRLNGYKVVASNCASTINRAPRSSAVEIPAPQQAPHLTDYDLSQELLRLYARNINTSENLVTIRLQVQDYQHKISGIRQAIYLTDTKMHALQIAIQRRSTTEEQPESAGMATLQSQGNLNSRRPHSSSMKVSAPQQSPHNLSQELSELHAHSIDLHEQLHATNLAVQRLAQTLCVIHGEINRLDQEIISFTNQLQKRAETEAQQQELNVDERQDSHEYNQELLGSNPEVWL